MNLPFIGTRLGILGAGFVAFGLADPANIVWLIGNPILWYHNHQAGQKEQAQMFLIYSIIAVIGIGRMMLTVFVWRRA